MIYAQRLSFPALPGGLKWFLLGWAVAEVVAFAFVVHLIGLGGAILLGLATTVVGIVMLRRIGADASRSLRRSMMGGEAPSGALLDGMLSAFGAVLLILPGFVSNLVGFALAAPSVRLSVAQRFGGAIEAGPQRRPSRAAPNVIDLGPDDWKTVGPQQ
ncbi:FxsA family protein [Lichenihabitans psoromatis]|uniref:FxsA family protein n=1 Tax=Lichenihabitans psoromatis TaxID=2528642 RepID=UPI00103859CD|nr:FxsA family protein [Lichenihabitans psoromatis]